MATATVSGFLDINNAGTPFDDLALKVYSGLVLGAFNKATVTQGRHITRMISSGKSAQFPATGNVGTVFHTRGTEISFQQVNSNERVISIQDLMLAPIFVDILDEFKSHFEIRQEYARQQGQALAEANDLRVLMSYIAASRASATVTGQPDGDRLTNASMGSTASVLRGAVYDAAEDFDEHNIPASERYWFVAPAQFYLVLEDGEFIDTDFQDSNGGKATGVMRNAAGFEIVKTTNLPTASEVGDTDFPTNLRLDYGTTVGVCAHRSAAGSVSLIDMQFETAWDPNRQGTMLIAKQAKGFDYLRPEAAVELATA